MVGSGVGGPEGATEFAYNAAQVGEKTIVKRRGDKRLAVLGAEDHVGEQVRVGVWHVLSPLRGLGGFYPNPLPIAHAMGYGLSPATRAMMLGGKGRAKGLRSSKYYGDGKKLIYILDNPTICAWRKGSNESVRKGIRSSLRRGSCSP